MKDFDIFKRAGLVAPVDEQEREARGQSALQERTAKWCYFAQQRSWNQLGRQTQLKIDLTAPRNCIDLWRSERQIRSGIS